MRLRKLFTNLSPKVTFARVPLHGFLLYFLPPRMMESNRLRWLHRSQQKNRSELLFHFTHWRSDCQDSRLSNLFILGLWSAYQQERIYPPDIPDENTDHDDNRERHVACKVGKMPRIRWVFGTNHLSKLHPDKLIGVKSSSVLDTLQSFLEFEPHGRLTPSFTWNVLVLTKLLTKDSVSDWKPDCRNARDQLRDGWSASLFWSIIIPPGLHQSRLTLLDTPLVLCWSWWVVPSSLSIKDEDLYRTELPHSRTKTARSIVSRSGNSTCLEWK
jgi:hypothetical protein